MSHSGPKSHPSPAPNGSLRRRRPFEECFPRQCGGERRKEEEAVKAPPRKSTNAPQYTAQYKRLFFPPSFPCMQGVRALLSQIEIDQISPLELKNEPLTPFEILHSRSKSLQCGLHNAAPAHMLSAAAARAATTKTASTTSLVSAAEQSSLNG